jgi:hypothetical protein
MAESQVSELQNARVLLEEAGGCGGTSPTIAGLGWRPSSVRPWTRWIARYKICGPTEARSAAFPRPWNAGRGVRQNGVAMLRHLERL